MSDIKELQDKYLRVYGHHPVDEAYLRSLESDLGVTLPHDFLLATKFFDGSGIVVQPLHAMALNPVLNVLSETVRLRSRIDLPQRFLVLGEPPESLLVLDCSSGQVIWCDAFDAPNLCKGALRGDPQIWASYGDFLAYLLHEEEGDRS